MRLQKVGPGSRHEGLKIAVKIRCAARGGRCGQLRALALALPGETEGDPVLILTTEGTPIHKKRGLLLETLVRDDFEGSADNVLCVDHEHNEHVQGSPTGQDRWPSLTGRRVYEGQQVVRGKVGMPLELLREPYQLFRKCGNTQPLDWKVGGLPVTIME